jgi:hypothetical protein
VVAGCAFLAFSGFVSAQEIMPATGGMVRLFPTDAAILEQQEARKEINCTVTPTKPSLGFDLKFHTGYDIAVPLKDLAGADNLLTMVFRVTPADQPDSPTLFSQKITVPQIEEDAGRRVPQGRVRRGRRQVPRCLADARSQRARLFFELGH